MKPKSELKTDLLTGIADRLAPHGFKLRKRQRTLVKKTPFGKVAVFIGIIDHPADFHVTISMGIRFDALQDLLFAGGAYPTASNSSETWSLGCELGNLVEGAQKRWEVYGEADVAPVCDSIVRFVEAHGLPYLDKYSDMQLALAVTSGDNRESRLHSAFDDYRAMRALGLAYLLEGRERFDALYESKKRYLEQIREPRLNAFLEFAAWLRRKFDEKQAG